MCLEWQLPLCMACWELNMSAHSLQAAPLPQPGTPQPGALSEQRTRVPQNNPVHPLEWSLLQVCIRLAAQTVLVQASSSQGVWLGWIQTILRFCKDPVICLLG